jgi:hydrogenase maturation protease
MKKSLIGYLGNPILNDDCIGTLLGKRLQHHLRKRDNIVVKELEGSLFSVVLEISGYNKVLLVDAILASQDIGSVILLHKNDIIEQAHTFYFHGMNLAEAIITAEKFGIRFPDKFLLAGIEAGGPVAAVFSPETRLKKFGGTLAPELELFFDEIYEKILHVVEEFFHLSREKKGTML